MARPPATGKHRLHGRKAIDAAFLAALFVVVLGVGFAVPQAYGQKLMPGVWVGDVAVGGQDQAEARTRVEARVEALVSAGLEVTVDEKQHTVAVEQAVTASDPTPPLVDIDVEASVAAAMTYGHAHGFLRNTVQAWRAMLFRKHVAPVLILDEERIVAALRQAFGQKDNPPKNARLVYTDGHFQVTPEQAGEGYQYEPAAAAAAKQWLRVTPARVSLSRGPQTAALTANVVADFTDDALAVVQRAPFTLTVEGQAALTLDAAAVGIGLEVVSEGRKPVLAFTAESLQARFDTLRAKVDVPAEESRFKVEDGRVVEFQAGQVGRAVDVAATVTAMNAALVADEGKQAAVVVKEEKPQSLAGSAVALGITEKVATGKTNFAGSPTNRRKNIANAVRLLNGLLIKPGEEFSLVKALSPIEISNGYLPELVIKGNRTVPEVGGGLCQVATTAFRLAMDAGLPILARRNHSYRVSYYEPPVGMDATIYDPAPDFKFKNDYATALLLQARVSGDNLIFDFYGTEDGRTASMTTPKLFAVTSPPPAKYIKTTDLAPGQRKRLERAHNGGSASFVYTVTKDGKTTNTTFNSKYRAWQEVWLVGATAEEVAAE